MSDPLAGTAFDVAVIGGGTAGLAAARTAARSGARTVLFERSDVLGGNAANAFVHTICGLYHAVAEGPARYAHEGFPAHFAERLRRGGAAAEVERAGKVYVLPIFPRPMSAIAATLCRETEELTTCTNAELVGADLSAEPVLRIAHRGSTMNTRASIVVDTSGDGNVAALGGAPFELADADTLQNPSLIFLVSGVDPEETRGFGRLRVSHAIAGAARFTDLPEGCESVMVRPGDEPGQAYVTLNVAKPGAGNYAPLDPALLDEMTKQARANAETLIGFLRRSRPGFRDCRVVEWPRRIGVRETRRIDGRESISRADILDGRRSDDEVAVSTWPIELWNDHRRAHFVYPAGPASVPFGALVSKTFPRLGMAGRCLSASHEALGALRVIGTAMATGEAIGAAAAIAANRGGDLRAVEPAEVRRHISELA
jgi:hypothetical protein